MTVKDGVGGCTHHAGGIAGGGRGARGGVTGARSPSGVRGTTTAGGVCGANAAPLIAAREKRRGEKRGAEPPEAKATRPEQKMATE
jgi:hypothetical protein